MPKFNVHVYVLARVKVERVEAETPEAACDAAVNSLDLHRMFAFRSQGHDVAYAEEVPSYLVDPLLPDGQVDYDESVDFDVVNGQLVRRSVHMCAQESHDAGPTE